MPIYMDRHDVSAEVTAEHVAQLHQEDLKIQHQFDCKGLTYWFDGKRKTAFCLIEAPNEEAIKQMHNKAHGEVPHRIIEVDDAIVESFLGRIEDPKKSRNTELNIINDPAFRTIMVIDIKRLSLTPSVSNQLDSIISGYSKSILSTIQAFKGSVVRQKPGCFLVSFDSVTKAVSCALEMQSTVKQVVNRTSVKLKVGISAGAPVTDKDGIFEDTIRAAERLCDFVDGEIVISSEVLDLYESENLNISMDKKLVQALYPSDEKFLNMLMDCMDREWSKSTLNASSLGKNLGYSKSKLYRMITPLTGKSPNTFIQEYRLNKALKLLNNRVHNISEIAFETGFKSPAYFTRVFRKRFGLSPTSFARLVVNT